MEQFNGIKLKVCFTDKIWIIWSFFIYLFIYLFELSKRIKRPEP